MLCPVGTGVPDGPQILLIESVSPSALFCELFNKGR